MSEMISFANEVANPEGYLPTAPATRSTIRTQPVQIKGQNGSIVENFQSSVEEVANYVKSSGFIFEPWQIAAYITAVRTKPFVILAGISGTGKTKLPRLIAEATGAEYLIVPVRPDWTDSSELLGYEKLDNSFQPGTLLRFAREAQAHPGKQYFFVLDEMNIARVEYYLAEVLSHLEERHINAEGKIVSNPLMPFGGECKDGIDWSKVVIPGNLCIVGSVNMDETTFGFSRKVLDRAFVIEFSTVDLSIIGSIQRNRERQNWTESEWLSPALSLAAHPEREAPEVAQIIETLTNLNSVLEKGQLQFGYRVRDEITVFCLEAQFCSEVFMTSDSGTVDSLDLAIAMKVLPRIQGSGDAIRNVLQELLKWASPSTVGMTGEPGAGEKVAFPFCEERLRLMLKRLNLFGYTSYWL